MLSILRKTNILIYIFVGFCFFVVKTKAISDENRQLTNKLDSILSKHFKSDAPGCAVLVSRKEQVVYRKAFGMADLELNVVMQADMVFEIASITKEFTAIAIMQLVEQGKYLLFSRWITQYC